MLVTMRGDRRNNGEIPPYWFLLYPCVACILRCIPSCIACITCITVSFQYPHHPSVVDLHYEQLLLKPLLEVTWLSIRLLFGFVKLNQNKTNTETAMLSCHLTQLPVQSLLLSFPTIPLAVAKKNKYVVEPAWP